MKVYLSPSMQQHNIYATNNTNEMVQCNRIAEYAETALKRCGFDVIKSKQGNSIKESVKESNEWGADIHIPIHTNASNGTSSGTLVMVYSNEQKNMEAATPIYNNVNAITPGKTEYGIQVRKDLYELNSTKAIAIYIECDFHDNKPIAEWIINNVRQLGEAICKGMCEYANVPYVEDKNNSDTIYRVQVGAFKNINNAKTLQKDLESKGYESIIIKK